MSEMQRGPEGREGREGREGPVGREGPQGIPGESDGDLSSEIRGLMDLVKANTAALRKSEEQREKTQHLAERSAFLAKAGMIMGAVMVVVIAALAFNIYQQQRNFEIQCENTNQTREAQRELWGGIVDGPNQQDTKAERENGEKFREYVNKVFADRDCENLDKKYEKPEFPELQHTGSGISHHNPYTHAYAVRD